MLADEAEVNRGVDFVGIGVSAVPQPEKGTAVIVNVLPGTPAEVSGLRPHDSLLAADGLPIVGGERIFLERLRGPECTAVVVTVQSPGQPPRDLTIVRARYSGPQPIIAELVATADGARVGYLFLPTFLDESIDDQVREALETWGPLHGLIVDNRMNGGGLGTIAEALLGFFTAGTVGDFVTVDGREPWDILADPIHNSQEVPLVVLVGEETTSYAEIFTGVLQSLGRASVVGQRTTGNVEQLHLFEFEDGSRVWLAAATFSPALSEADWETDGIVPDLEVVAAWDSFTYETDPGIAAALTLLGH